VAIVGSLVLKLDPSPGGGGNGPVTPLSRQVLKSDKEIKREQPEQSRNGASDPGDDAQGMHRLEIDAGDVASKCPRSENG
jgi:hypothetical protein